MHNVLALDDRVFERLHAAIAGRPDLLGDRKSLTLYEGMTGITENKFTGKIAKVTVEWK